MQAEVKQIMSAPGWRVLVCDSINSIGEGRPREVPVVGWGVVEFANDPKHQNCPRKFVEMELLVYYMETVLPVRMFHEYHIACAAFPPGTEITQDDKDGLLDDAQYWRDAELKERREKRVSAA